MVSLDLGHISKSTL